MLITIPKIILVETAARLREELERAEWRDGRLSAGYLSQGVKSNQQLADADPTSRRLGEAILVELEAAALFTAAALPLKVLPPLFNRYRVGESYGRHVDGAIRPVAGTHHSVRTDLSATLFLSAPDSYDGGELVIEDTYGERSVKLAAGDMILYPGTSVHRIEPVTRGTRYAAFFWVQSRVRDATQRGILFRLDQAIQQLAADEADRAALVELAGVYHNLLRLWADA